MKPTTKA